ncbi:MAG: BamA/TamA family outer membrane protein [Leptolyngbya sp. RL_3_1]|nr:BamA/TamA family outer membrane protein [Leptolyngbya sp. RL_3_1]
MKRKQLRWTFGLISALTLVPGIVRAEVIPALETAVQANPLTVASPASPGPVLAQVDPSGDRFPGSEPPTPVSPEESADPLPDTSPPDEPPSTTPPTAGAPFQVTDIQVVGSSIFDAATIDAIVAPYENRQTTLAELQQLADAITQRYLNEGYITSRAVVGPQTIVDGVVEIQVIEGSLQAIEVEGTAILPDYIRARVALGSTRPLNQGQLEDQLRLLRSDPLFETVEASLRAGDGAGQSILIVRVREANRFSGSITSDNYSPISVGDVRFGGQFAYRSVAVPGDRFSTSMSWSDTRGSEVYDLAYQVPINPMNGTLQFRFTPNFFRITDSRQPAFALGIRGTTEIYDFTYRQPLIRTPREELSLSAGFRHRSGSTLIAGLITDETRTSVLSFGQDYIRRDPVGAWALRSQFRWGTTLLNATQAAAPLADGQFFSWIGQVQRVQILDPDHLLIFQTDVQLANESLLGSEQFFLGGGLSVRGYAQNQRFGDNGIRFSIEDQITLQRDEGGQPLLRIAPFLEGGYVWDENTNFQSTSNNFLLGSGIGIIANPFPQFNARFDFALPLIDVGELTTDPPQGLRFYFSLGYQF